jgi:hypothetical protein
VGGPQNPSLEAMYFGVGVEVVGPGRQLGGSGHNEMSRNHSTLKNFNISLVLQCELYVISISMLTPNVSEFLVLSQFKNKRVKGI